MNDFTHQSWRCFWVLLLSFVSMVACGRWGFVLGGARVVLVVLRKNTRRTNQRRKGGNGRGNGGRHGRGNEKRKWGRVGKEGKEGKE